jgi:peroxiredoxin
MTRFIGLNDEPTDPDSPTEKSPSAAQSCRDPTNLGRCALRAGELAPGFRLPDQLGHMVTLRTLLTKGPVVLRFCRHDGTPSCFREMDVLAALHVDVEQRGATLAAIAAQRPLPYPPEKYSTAYAFRLLTDKAAKVARSYGITSGLPPIGPSPETAAYYNGSLKQRASNGSALATYIVDQESVVALACVDLEGRRQMEPDQIVMALECLSKREESKSGTPDAEERGEKL